LIGGIGPAKADIFHDIRGENDAFLRHNADESSDFARICLANIHTTDCFILQSAFTSGRKTNMNTLSEILRSRRVNLYSGFALAFLWVLFAYAHLFGFIKTREYSLLLFWISEALVVAFFIFRSQPKTVSMNPLDWIVAIGGTFAPLCFRPAPWGILPLAGILIIAGAIIQILSVISLNRSFALVAAKREIKTRWMYRIVRHPLYASYCLTFVGYVLKYTTPANSLIYRASMKIDS
ncbi:MAG: hypothetical protein ACRER2_10640, partial [Methylococcales bacterium]